jgi:hypothetical protein
MGTGNKTNVVGHHASERIGGTEISQSLVFKTSFGAHPIPGSCVLARLVKTTTFDSGGEEMKITRTLLHLQCEIGYWLCWMRAPGLAIIRNPWAAPPPLNSGHTRVCDSFGAKPLIYLSPRELIADLSCPLVSDFESSNWDANSSSHTDHIGQLNAIEEGD